MAMGNVEDALRNKTLEYLINKWNRELASSTQKFKQQAKQVMEWDTAIVSLAHRISTLHSKVQTLTETQRRVDDLLEYIGSQQSEMHQVLEGYEEVVQQMLQTKGLNHSVAGSADLDREVTFQLAVEANSTLDELARNLDEFVQDLNSRTMGDTNTTESTSGDPLQQVVSILNSHLRALEWIDDTTESLYSQAEKVQRIQRDAEKEHERVHSTRMSGFR
jgi:nuclear pore complex protein Nup62